MGWKGRWVHVFFLFFLAPSLVCFCGVFVVLGVLVCVSEASVLGLLLVLHPILRAFRDCFLFRHPTFWAFRCLFFIDISLLDYVHCSRIRMFLSEERSSLNVLVR